MPFTQSILYLTTYLEGKEVESNSANCTGMIEPSVIPEQRSFIIAVVYQGLSASSMRRCA